MTQRILAVAALASCLLGSALPLPAANSPEPVRIGMVGTLFNDIPPSLIQFAGGPFKMLMKEFTGLDGQLIVGGNAYEVGKKLVDKQLDLAVFHGFEYGWARQKYPDLRPLTIAVSKFRQVNAFLVVKADSDIKTFADLKDKDVGFPRKSKEHCKLFMERACADNGQCEAKQYFHQVCASANADDSLDDILRDKLQAVVIDNASLEEYEQFKPGCFARLKIVKRSEPFPAAVIVYREGALDEQTLKRFRDGMISANQSQRGRDMMSIFKMTAFEPVPADYGQQVAEILRHYPAPESADKVSQK
jgi:ABC-type phosphate/phosphonate transport system substrate-binding protein